MARDFWLQALETSCVIASRTSTRVRAIPLGSPRVLEIFWTRSFGIGVTGEYFDRRTFYQDADRTIKRFHYPQVRAFVTWRIS